MSKTEIALIVVGIGALIAIILAMRGSGPRVTTIETRRDSTDAKGE